MIGPVAISILVLAAASDRKSELSAVMSRAMLLGRAEILWDYVEARIEDSPIARIKAYNAMTERLARWAAVEPETLDELVVRMRFLIQWCALDGNRDNEYRYKPGLWRGWEFLKTVTGPWSNPKLKSWERLLRPGWNPSSETRKIEIRTFGGVPAIGRRHHEKDSIQPTRKIGIQVLDVFAKNPEPCPVLSWDPERIAIATYRQEGHGRLRTAFEGGQEVVVQIHRRDEFEAVDR